MIVHIIVSSSSVREIAIRVSSRGDCLCHGLSCRGNEAVSRINGPLRFGAVL